MRHSRTLLHALLAASVCAQVACSDTEAPLASGSRSPAEVSLQADKNVAPAHHALARLIALSLREPARRAALYRSLLASPVKERKLHLGKHLGAEGATLLAGMARVASLEEAQVLELLESTGALEIYLPEPRHRELWRGGDDLIVATQLAEEEVPYGVDLAGRPVALSLTDAPARPTLVIVPAESFDGEGRPLARRLGDGPSGAAPDATTWIGLWVNEVHVGDVHEPWTKGSPEFEMHLEKASGQERSTITCAEEDLSVEPYRWDMDGEDYYDPFLLAQDSEIPEDKKLVVSLWEDDDGRCVLKTYEGSDYVKLVTDYLRAVSDIYKAIEYKRFLDGRFVLVVRRALIAGRSLILGGDDFVGVAAGLSKIDETPKVFVLKGENAVNTGTLTVQWRTVTLE